MSVLGGNDLVQVEVNGFDMLTLDFIPGETTAQLIQRITDEQGWQYRTSPSLQDTSQNTTCDGTELVQSGRVYYLSVWIRSQDTPKTV